MHLEQALAALELQLEEVSAALLAVDPLTLEQCSSRLRQAVLGFSGIMEGVRQQPLPPGMESRLQKVSAMLSMQRENLARLCTVADRQVASVLPPADDTSTYGKTAGVRGGVPRIYRSAG